MHADSYSLVYHISLRKVHFLISNVRAILEFKIKKNEEKYI